MYEKPFIGTPTDYSDPDNWLASARDGARRVHSRAPRLLCPHDLRLPHRRWRPRLAPNASTPAITGSSSTTSARMPRTASISGSRPIRLQNASSRRSEERWRRTQPHGRAPLPLPSSYSPDARGSRNIWRQSSLPASVLNTRSSAERAARSPAPSSKRFTSMSASRRICQSAPSMPV